MDVLNKAEPARRAAQVQVKDLLGKAAFIAVMDLASRIIDCLGRLRHPPRWCCGLLALVTQRFARRLVDKMYVST
jgi:hypothetical protein